MPADFSGYTNNGVMLGALVVPAHSGCVCLKGKLYYVTVCDDGQSSWAVDLFALEGVPVFAGGVDKVAKKYGKVVNGGSLCRS